MINESLVRKVLTELLEIPDGMALPNFAGVCWELGVNGNSFEPHLTLEFKWAESMTKKYMDDDDFYGFVSPKGYMNPRRRDFIQFLLKEMDNDASTSTSNS